MTTRALTLGVPPPRASPIEHKIDWLMEAMVKVDRWSAENVSKIAQDFTVSNVTATRTLDANAGTLADLAAAEAAIDATRDVLATLIQDIQRGGSKRT